MAAPWLTIVRAVVPDEAVIRSLLDSEVREALRHLSEREQLVMRLRFGLDDGKIRTLDEVSKEFGLAGERIRQIESKILAKLRRRDATQLLWEYLQENWPDEPEEPGGGSRVREPRRPSPTSGPSFAALPEE
jgi:DNA-directed RNA polymerase sigma subunit (sigma70/sigma32)